MRHRPGGVYDEKRVTEISADVAAAIDAATFGTGSWDEVTAALSKAFPGSFGGLWNMNFAGSRLNFQSWANVDPAFVKSYLDHFAYVNPWTAYWSAVENGLVALSEEVHPARLFADTEFYNDWLRPQKDAEAAAGMKLVGDHGEGFQCVIHFPLSLAEDYGQAALGVLTGVRGNLARSIDLAHLLRKDVEAAAITGALVERSRCAAFVIEENRLIREANHAAEQLFSSGQSVIVRNERCFLPDKEADSRFGAALDRLARKIPTDETRISFRTTAGVWQITLAALPSSISSNSLALLMPSRPLILALVTEIQPAITDAVDLSALRVTFGLTPSEISFCRRMLFGETVSGAAEQLGITVETARTRLKSILQKTGTSRQGQLMLLLSKLQ